MILFVGLGNPGDKYEKTPHNAGFMALDRLRIFLGNTSAYDVGDWEFNKYAQSSVCIGKSDNERRFVLVKPLTFMNKSGDAVEYLLGKFEINPEKELVVFYDDLDIKLGDVKITKGKNPKGHKGLMSIFNSIKFHNFLSVRIGIDNRENENIPGEDYVLREYSDEELEILDKAIAESIKKVRLNMEV
jgi:peptidyl-tRNA hydrolase, PTH1 family